ncbi:GDSL esterase/lipase At1g29670 [Morus notabilis]|uniref:GDSL esterase/lipase At1g29670 n=1 Tax=Morus notabilis TaxID=981085 RepID=UPI000CED18DC|nr:GDSL esterase/lipase At1g29670 [Morus notabilis]
MASSETHSKMLFVIFLLCFLSYLSLCTSQSNNCAFPDQEITTRANRTWGLFVFGSSLVDNGNNNFFENRAQVNYLPYGIDFPNGPTGRFTDGKNLVDLLGELLNLPNLIPPFKDPTTKGRKIVYGVNHASGSSGILDETSLISGNVTSLSQQIRDFQEVTLPELEVQLGCNSSDSLPGYLFVVGVGGNDILFNYFLRQTYPRVDPQTFTANLTAILSQRLQKLYSLGARKFVLTAVYPLGNSPLVELNMPNCTVVCAQAINQVAQIYNRNLRSMVEDFQRRMPDSNLVVIETYNIVSEILLFPASRGFTNTRSSCCAVVSRTQGGNGVLCERGGRTCPNKKVYVYFDGLHPTEAVNIQIANDAYTSRNIFKVYPINVQQLSQL